MVSYNFAGLFGYKDPNDNAGDVWINKPTASGILIYSVFTPCICLCGMIMNFLCIIVLRKKQLCCSFYNYLLVISVVDFVCCVLLFVSGLARGILWSHKGWISYDALISIPLGNFLSCLGTIATVSVTVDRLIYLWNPVRMSKPRFCRKTTAKIVVVIGIVAAIAFALPYCFIFEFSKYEMYSYVLTTTKFYDSWNYFIFNWVYFVLFAIFPLVLLSIGNTLLILSIKKAHAMRMKSICVRNNNEVPSKFPDQTKVTITLIAIVFFFMVGELPTHITAREAARNILFCGDDEKTDTSQGLEMARQIVAILNALHLTIKFMLYCLFCPPFYQQLKETVFNSKRKQKKMRESQTLKVFVVSSKTSKTPGCDLKMGSFNSHVGFMNTVVVIKAWEGLPKFI